MCVFHVHTRPPVCGARLRERSQQKMSMIFGRVTAVNNTFLMYLYLKIERVYIVYIICYGF